LLPAIFAGCILSVKEVFAQLLHMCVDHLFVARARVSEVSLEYCRY
jgi:hypothetical protein